MNPLQLEMMARDRMAERDRTLAAWAIARSTRRTPPSPPAPLPPLRPLPPSPRLRVPRRAGGSLGTWLHRLQVRVAGALG